MKKRTIFLAIIIIAGIIIFSATLLGKNSDKSITGKTVLNSSEMDSLGITSETLLAHFLEEDCWIAYNEKVYDITSWLQKHPGGVKAILPYCGTGKEFREAFEKKHGTAKVALLIKVGKLMGDLNYKGNLNEAQA
jgi:cytochrome b involved in lipid metabolism